METLQVEITNQMKVFTIRELFTKEFRNLKLEFYAKPDGTGSHPDRIVRNSGFTVGDCRTSNRNGLLTVKPEMTVSELKACLSDTFGLHTEVYRWIDASWQVIDSSTLSLKELNRVNSLSM